MLTVVSPGLPGREFEILDVGLIDYNTALHLLHLGLQIGNGVVRSDGIEHDLVGCRHGQDYRTLVVDDRPGRILGRRPRIGRKVAQRESRYATRRVRRLGGGICREKIEITGYLLGRGRAGIAGGALPEVNIGRDAYNDGKVAGYVYHLFFAATGRDEHRRRKQYRTYFH